ncbi:MAG: SO2930 family diheme c-type cytochrome [Rhizobiaceae bacterium]
MILLWIAFLVTPLHAQPSAEAILAARPPAQLSEFAFFDDLRAQKPAVGVTPFALATPLFSDGALKYRFVHMPEGKSAAWHDTESFEFPVGTALIKSFAFPADYRRPDKDIRIVETRLLLRDETGWNAWAYVWNDEQTDATLKIAGARVDIETVTAAGEPLSFTYSVPNKNQCKGCHALSGEIEPLGPKARNLNTEIAYATGEENQLAQWVRTGLLSGAPDLASAPAAPDWRDASAPLDARARAWLDVNCAHCHRREGPASNSGLFLTFGEVDRVALGIGKRPVAAGKGSGGREFDIVPGDPDASIMVYRVDSVEPGVMMPELGRHLADPDAVALLREWIADMR